MPPFSASLFLPTRMALRWHASLAPRFFSRKSCRRFPRHGFCGLGWPSAGTHRSNHGFSRVRAVAVSRVTLFPDSDGPPRRGVRQRCRILGFWCQIFGRDLYSTCIHGTWHFLCSRRVPPFSCPGGPKLDSEALAALIFGFCRMGCAAVFRVTVFADSDVPPLARIARTTAFLA